MNLAIRKKLVDEGAAELERKSVRMGVVGIRNRELFAAAFVDTMDEGGDIVVYRDKCRDYGISPMLIIFLLSVAWDVLFYLWKRRHPDDA